MDPTTIVERADTIQQDADLLPVGSGDPKWIATDPDTGCEGVGEFEEAARANLVYAVEAYRNDPEDSVPFLASANVETVKMEWRNEGSGLGERLFGFLDR
ncbi:MAG: hypothetical protein ABEJ58_04335 [Halodesulfurarchaeum sp.]